MKQNQKGFTLIELLVVVAIIGLLASVIVVSLNSARAKARDAKRAADIAEVKSAVELFFNEKGTYPPQVAASGGWTTSAPDTDATTGIGATMPTLPVPPAAESSCSGMTYKYVTNTGKDAYYLQFCLSAATGSYAAGNNYIGSQGVSTSAPTLP